MLLAREPGEEVARASKERPVALFAEALDLSAKHSDSELQKGVLLGLFARRRLGSFNSGRRFGGSFATSEFSKERALLADRLVELAPIFVELLQLIGELDDPDVEFFKLQTSNFGGDLRSGRCSDP